MDGANPSPGQTAQNGAATGPYDVALYLARSLGKSLPVIVVIGLIAFGAYYGLREMSNLQTQLHKAEQMEAQAEIKKTQAEAEASEAADKAQNQALQEYTKQLMSLNAVSEDVSKRLQDMVSTTLDNVKKEGELREAEDKKSRELQAQIEQKSTAELASLRDQISGAKAKYDDLARTASLSGYSDLKNKIADQLKRDLYIDSQVLDLLGSKLDDPTIQSQAVKDAGDSAEGWQIRLALYLQLFKSTSNAAYLENVRLLADQNKLLASSATASLFCRYGAFSDEQALAVLPVISAFIIDDAFPSAFRDQMVTFPTFASNTNVLWHLNADLIMKLARYAGKRLAEVAGKSDGVCYPVTSLLGVLKGLSPEAELVYATRALQNPGGREDFDKQCIKSELEKSVNGRHPTDEQIQRWTGSLTAGNAHN